MYRFVDAAVVRAAAERPGLARWWPDLGGDTDEHVEAWVEWLRQIWGSSEFAAGVEIASPPLADRVQQVCDGRQVGVRECRRTVRSIVRYVQRAAGRATPFGVFAGVAPVRLGDAPKVRLGEDHRAFGRVDGAWLDALITSLEARRELWPRLVLVGTNLNRPGSWRGS